MRNVPISAARHRQRATPVASPDPPVLPSADLLGGPRPLLLKIVDLGLIAILVIAPFFMGGRQAFGQLTLCFLASATAVVWSIYQWSRGDARWKFTGVEPIMLLGLGLIVLQCCQLTPDLINAVSPRVHRLLPEWEANPELLRGVWQRISFTPSDTWSDFVVIIACLLFFFVAVQRISTTADLCAFVRIVALGGGLMATFGLVQFLWSNGEFYWFYRHPMTGTDVAAKGAFTNANHFANYLAMSIPAQIFLIVSHLTETTSEKTAAATPAARSGDVGWRAMLSEADYRLCGWSLLLAITCFGIFCSGSRIGLLSASTGVLLSLLIFWQKSMLSTRRMLTGIGMLVIGLTTMPLVCPPAGESAELRLPHADAKAIATNCDRTAIWNANIQGIREFPLAGTGLGSHHEVYWLWFNSPQDGKEYSHAENGYLQIALETGLTGLGLVILLWLTSLLWCAQGLWNASTPQTKGIMAVVTAGLLISLLQSITDFVWYVPACVNVVLLYAICAWRVSLMRFFEPTSTSIKCRTSSFNLSRISWVCAIPVLSALGYWMVQEKLPELAAEPIWDEYLRLTLSQPANNDPRNGIPRADQPRRIELALAAARANPRAQRLRLHAGLACLNQFALNQSQQQHHMPLSQIRDAARSLFTSTEEMDQWLDRPGVLGSERKLLKEAVDHFRASLQSCPLQPRPYLELAELVWLEGIGGHAERDLVEQAVAARPCDARAQFAMGRLLWLNGEHKAAAEHWQFAFRQDAGYRGHLITSLAAYVPARFFLDYFEPDHESLKQLRKAYQTAEDHLGYQLVLESLARSSMKVAMAQRGANAEAEWSLAHECFAELGDLKGAYHSGREAVAANPQSYSAHQTFGLWLYRNGYFAESVDELSWCAKHHPQETWLTLIAIDAQRKIDAGESTPATQIAEEPGRTIIR